MNKPILTLIISLLLFGCAKKNDVKKIVPPENKLTLSIKPWNIMPGDFVGNWAAGSYVSNQVVAKNNYLYRCVTKTTTDPELLISPYWQKLGPYSGEFSSEYNGGYPNGNNTTKGGTVYLSNLQDNKFALDAPNTDQYISLESPSVYIAWWGDSLTDGTGSSAGSNAPLDLSRITGFNVYNGGVPGETSTQIRTRFFKDTARWKLPTIIWAGRNNYSKVSMVEADIAAMVAALGHSRFVVLGIIKANNQTDQWVDILNDHLKQTYGTRFLDMQAYLFSKYNPSLTQDAESHLAGNIAWSLHSDWLHLNNDGYLLCAQYLSKHMP